ncbi:MAG: hypothetical protein IJS50_04025, partial [Desulfovibrio sp.]|nr:hypothetical protein [Desulfovibrio sp.]
MSRCLTLFLALVLILGNAISSPCRSLRGAKLVEERVCTLNFGLNNGVTNTEIFKYSGRAQQGMAYVNYQGQESLFITVRSDRNDSPSKGQACSITQFNFVNGKLDPNPVVFTKVLPIGHGQGFGAMIRNGELYFICQSAYTSDKSTIYRSVSVVHWRGAKTSAKDVVEIPILPSTGHLARYNFITPNISSDGKYLVALCNDRKTKGSACLIFDLASLAPYPKPLHIFPISSKHAKGRGWQGLCADERYIYFVYGPIHSLAPHIVTIYNYQGEQINDFLIQDEKAAYGYEQGIINSPEGVPWNIELE